MLTMLYDELPTPSKQESFSSNSLNNYFTFKLTFAASLNPGKGPQDDECHRSVVTVGIPSGFPSNIVAARMQCENWGAYLDGLVI